MEGGSVETTTISNTVDEGETHVCYANKVDLGDSNTNEMKDYLGKRKREEGTTSFSVLGSFANWFIPKAKASEEVKGTLEDQGSDKNKTLIDLVDSPEHQDSFENKSIVDLKGSIQDQASSKNNAVLDGGLYYCTLCFNERCSFTYDMVNTCTLTSMTGLQWNRNFCPWECQMNCMIGNYHNLTEPG